MSRSKGYKCYNIRCNSCLGKSLCTEPGDEPLACVNRVINGKANEDYKKSETELFAEWENNADEYPECTNCGYMPAYDSSIDDIWYSPFCPQCGAKMKNGEALE